MSSGGMYFDTATRRTGEKEAPFTVERTEERDEAMCCCLDWDDMLHKMYLVRTTFHRSSLRRFYHMLYSFT